MNSGDIRSFFSYVNKRRKTKSNVAPLRMQNNELAYADQDKSSILSDFYQTIFTVDNNIAPLCPLKTQASLETVLFTPDVVYYAMKKLPLKYSSCPDGYPIAFLKLLARDLCIPLSKIYTKSMETGTLPLSWKNADIVPIYKRGDSSLAQNYRPRTVLQPKLLHSIVYNIGGKKYSF